MKTEIITLRITVEDFLKLPHEWNWEDLIDLSPNESVEIMEYREDDNV